jgi:hypothetical protein
MRPCARRVSAASSCLLPALLVLSAIPASAFERSERREVCVSRDPLRNPYFGDTHVHTAYSFDANALGVRNTPRDAYRFARGEPVGLQPFDHRGVALRSVRLDRPLDFAVVTDHASLLGEVHICNSPGAEGYESLVCRIYRRWPLLSYYLVNSRIFNVSSPARYSFCGEGGGVCRAAAAGPWRRIQQAAEGAYDRSAACEFTSFVGYEWTGNPDGNMIHRNVIFRNRVVQVLPTSYVDVQEPEGLWQRLRAECLDLDNGCDVLAIPHNSNISGGWLFQTVTGSGSPITRDYAERRSALEPLLEVMQHKGDSECRVRGLSEDELCGFEKLPFARMDQQPLPFRWSAPPPMVHAREVLAEGLVQEERLGANPFKLGLIASTDTHLGTPGLVQERGYPGHGAGGDTSRVQVPRIPDALEFNPGGLAVLWAEENSRDALFEAMRRRESYGTSGPRMVVRFFGGWDLPSDLCEREDFAERGYRDGVPMGGDLWVPPAGTTRPAPRFGIWALADPGTPESSPALLQRVQIIKLWAEQGRARERVYEVSGDPRSSAGVDPDTCQREGEGFDSLCAVWSDPDFDPSRHALYYARVLENPSCRWSTYVCNAERVDCSKPATVPGELGACCDPSLPRTVQERAWTSPIWVRPAPPLP